MLRIVVLVLALLLVAFVAKKALEGTASPREEHSAPRRQLDQVRDKARELERQQQEAADKAAQESEKR